MNLGKREGDPGPFGTRSGGRAGLDSPSGQTTKHSTHFNRVTGKREHIQKSVTKIVKGLGRTKDEVEIPGREKNLEGTRARGITWRWEQMCALDL